MSDTDSSTIYSAMQTDNPFKTYRKVQPSKLEVKYLDPFKGTMATVILQGKNDHIDVWSEKEDAFLKRMNAYHIEKGNLIPTNRKATPPPEINKFNVLTDEELFDLLGSPFYKLQQALNKMTSQAPVFRLLTIAEQEEKSERQGEIR